MITLVVNGLISLIKQMELPTRIIPALAVLIGIGVSYLYTEVSREATIDGIIAALAAMGLWSGTKATVKTSINGSEK